MNFKTMTKVSLAGLAMSGIIATSAIARDDGKALFAPKSLYDLP